MQETSIRIRKALAHVPWLQASGEAALHYLADQASLDQVADGTTVTWRGRQMTHLLVPVRGVLELSITNAQGKRHVVNRQEPGQVFGLIPVLEDSGAIHDAVARGACEIVRVPQAALRQAMRAYPELNDQIIRVLCARARKSYQSLAAQTLAALPARLARVLLGQSQGAASATLAMTQADLADMLGVTRQSLNVELKRLERQGLVGLGRGRIEIKDQTQLAQLATACD
ncbi:Crp/Fnr family transcriptional regulator [Comamonas humi]